MSGAVTLRLYEDDDRRAKVEDAAVPGEVDLFGWSYQAGSGVAIGDRMYVLSDVGATIHTDDRSGAYYRYATAEPQ